MSTPSRAEWEEHCNDLHGCIVWLLDHPGYTWDEDGDFCFPNGEMFHKKDDSQSEIPTPETERTKS